MVACRGNIRDPFLSLTRDGGYERPCSRPQPLIGNASHKVIIVIILTLDHLE